MEENRGVQFDTVLVLVTEQQEASPCSTTTRTSVFMAPAMNADEDSTGSFVTEFDGLQEHVVRSQRDRKRKGLPSERKRENSKRNQH